MLNAVWVIAPNAKNAAGIIGEATVLGAQSTLVTADGDAKGTDRVLVYDGSMVAALPELERLCADERPDLIFCDTSYDGRLAAAALAVVLKTSPLVEPVTIKCDDNAVSTTRVVYGGAALQEESASYPAVVVAGANTFEPVELKPGGTVDRIEAKCPDGVEYLGGNDIEAGTARLDVAKHVIGVGRGLGEEENTHLVDKLAAMLDAEVGCTRPVAEEEGWYAKDRYIGISGLILSPDFYLAIGISGQVQHMVGVNQSKTIFAIDKNANAPIFRQCDYGLVGDVSAVLLALIDALEQC